jgi:hypothetical protein
MLPYYTSAEKFITKEDVVFLEHFLLDSINNSRTDFVAYDTISGNKDGNLCWDCNIEKFNKFNFNSYNFFIKQEPNTKVKKHIDNPKWKRNTVILIPLFWHQDYAPAYYIDGVKVTHETPIFFNTQLEHYVNNNDYNRYNFQICFEEPIEEVVDCLTLT